jgi:TolB protein
MRALRSIGAALLAGSTLAPQTASAQQPERVVYESLRTGDSEVWSVTPEGTQQRNLTKSPSTEDVTPAVSPDGKQVAFVRGAGERGALWIMNADGSGQRPLGTGAGSALNPAWSPQGDRIAYSRLARGDWDIVVTTLSGVRSPVTSGTGDDVDVSWSPDGKLLVFPRLSKGTSDLWTVDPDVRKPERLTTTSRVAELAPAWSPNGREIAYDAAVGGRYDLFALDVATRKPRRITNDANDDGEPAWSPDGQRIAFRRGVGRDYEISVVTASGNGRPRNISRDPAGIELAPSWSVDAAGAPTFTARAASIWVWVCDEKWKGTSGEDDYNGNSHRNKMCGLGADDKLVGRKDRDWLSGGTGEDNLYGKEGRDRLKAREADPEDDYVSGGDGYDTALLDSGDEIKDVENPHW